MTQPLPSNDQSAPPKERRNWKIRSYFSIALRRGPVRYFTGGAIVLAAIAALLVWRFAPSTVRGDATVAYSDAAQALAARQVAALTVTDDGGRLVLSLRTPRMVGGHEIRTVETVVPAKAVTLGDLERWSAAGTTVRVVEPQTGSMERLLQIVSILFLV